MRVLYISLDNFLDKCICDCFNREGHEVSVFTFPQAIEKGGFVTLSEQNRYELAQVLQRREYEFVFSLSYIHEVSVFCNMLSSLYLSWVIEYPNMDIYRQSVTNPCNCFFISSLQEVERLQMQGVENVFFLPAGAIEAAEPIVMEVEEEKTIEEELEEDKKEEEYKRWKYEVSFVGKVTEPKSDSPFGDVLNLSPESRGYLDGLTHCQRITYDYNVMHYGVPAYVMKELQEKYPLMVPGDVTGSIWNMYVKKCMLDQITYQERVVLFQQINQPLTVFTGQNKEENIEYEVQELPKDFNDYQEIMDKSKINLCILDRQYVDAVPWQIFEILAKGGFVVCNKQSGMSDLFLPGEEFAMFEDVQDLDMKLRIYLSNDKRRLEIAESARKKVEKEHLIEHRIRTMLEIMGV